jgi:hypothetical protein
MYQCLFVSVCVSVCVCVDITCVCSVIRTHRSSEQRLAALVGVLLSDGPFFWTHGSLSCARVLSLSRIERARESS